MVVREPTVSWPDGEDTGKAIAGEVRINGQPPHRVGRETGPGDQFADYSVRVERIGGQRGGRIVGGGHTYDEALVEFACFGDGYEAAKAVAAAVDHVAENSTGKQYGDAVIDSAWHDNGPIRPAWGGNDARRYITQWRFRWRPNVSD